MTTDVTQWLGSWVSFERIIHSDDPALLQAWHESTVAMRGKLMFRLLMRGDARRFWRWACRTVSRENLTPVGGWVVSRAADSHRETLEFNLRWLRQDGSVLGDYRYRLDHMIDRGLEGKPCYVFHAVDAPDGSPFRVLIAMDPMPERGDLADGGLLSHLHFQYGSSERKLLKGAGPAARLRRRLWYPTMCADEGTVLDQCNIVRALHQLTAWSELPRAGRA